MMEKNIGLQAKFWAQSSQVDRLEALFDLEQQLAEQDGRNKPCYVIVDDLPKTTNGQYHSEEGSEYIALNQKLINDPEPYQAVETLFHESRHAFQHHIVSNPELAEDQALVEKWEMSEKGGYIQPNEINYSTYRWQPTEFDANNIARTRTDELYQDTFQDTEQYPEYRSQKEQEFTDQVEYAETELGEGYIEKADQAMINRYQQNLSPDLEMEEESAVQEGGKETQEKKLHDNPGNDQSISADDGKEEALSEGEDHNYGYSHGY